ncbi:hypothetical protein BC937DRAFT_87679 [Endogone sp. FLAS-F59071]|nr:hypothetical protein BC937DRAFT_87679 [Endogone sp. FLAS-F59071]|eukprot:RUS22697.1 hypothetical protein BC937DRAFT_87679 [Endogone sp. FLAS-F59071]
MNPTPTLSTIIGTTRIRTQEWRIFNFGKARQLYTHDMPFLRKIFWFPSSGDGGPPLSWYLILYPSGKDQTFDCVAASFGAEPTAVEREQLSWQREPIDYGIEAYSIASFNDGAENPAIAVQQEPVFMDRTTGMGKIFSSVSHEITTVRFLSYTKTPKWDAKKSKDSYDLLIKLHFVVSGFHNETLGPPIKPKINIITDFTKPTDPLSAFIYHLNADPSADVTFTFSIQHPAQPPPTLRSHRILLASRSVYFATMLSVSPPMCDVYIPDAMHTHFAVLLYHLYSGSLPATRLPARTLRDVYRAAHMYYLSELMSAIEEAFWRRLGGGDEAISLREWQEYLAFAIENALERLRRAVVCWIVDQWEPVKGSRGMEEFGKRWERWSEIEEGEWDEEAVVHPEDTSIRTSGVALSPQRSSDVLQDGLSSGSNANDTIATESPSSLQANSETLRHEHSSNLNLSGATLHSPCTHPSQTPQSIFIGPTAEVDDAMAVLSQDIEWLRDVFMRLNGRVTPKGWTCECCGRVLKQV